MPLVSLPWLRSAYNVCDQPKHLFCHVLQADRIQQLYPEAERVRLQSGHCPHDDTPEEANAALLEWLERVYKR